MVTTKGVELLQKIEFNRHAVAEAKAAHLRQLEANRPRTKVVITCLPSSRDEWELVTQAGVSFWVHHETGEVSQECPYDVTRPPTAQRRAEGERIGEGLTETGEEDEQEATGALVYDNSEYAEYLKMLGGDSDGER